MHQFKALNDRNGDTLPAHDFVREQHAAHLRVLVLALVNNGLFEKSISITNACTVSPNLGARFQER